MKKFISGILKSVTDLNPVDLKQSKTKESQWKK